MIYEAKLNIYTLVYVKFKPTQSYLVCITQLNLTSSVRICIVTAFFKL